MHDDTGAGNCTEILNNIEAVQDYIRGAQTAKSKLVRAYLKRLTNNGKTSEAHPGATLLEVQYVTKHGRRYAVGPSLQYLPKEVRSLLYRYPTLVGIDFQCSIPVMLVTIAGRMCWSAV